MNFLPFLSSYVLLIARFLRILCPGSEALKNNFENKAIIFLFKTGLYGIINVH